MANRAAVHAEYVDVNHLILVSLGPIALFIKYRSTGSSGTKIKKSWCSCFMPKVYLISSNKNSNPSSIDCYRIKTTHEQKLTNSKTT